MNTPTDAALDGLIARLDALTGDRWKRQDAWDVAVTVLIGGKTWGYSYPVRLMHLDADPAGYARMIATDFELEKLNAIEAEDQTTVEVK